MSPTVAAAARTRALSLYRKLLKSATKMPTPNRQNYIIKKQERNTEQINQLVIQNRLSSWYVSRIRIWIRYWSKQNIWQPYFMKTEITPTCSFALQEFGIKYKQWEYLILFQQENASEQENEELCWWSLFESIRMMNGGWVRIIPQLLWSEYEKFNC